MKKISSIGFALFLTTLSLVGCVKNQDSTTSATTVAAPNQSINDTNYQEMMMEQANRVQMEEATSHPHVGGRR